MSPASQDRKPVTRFFNRRRQRRVHFPETLMMRPLLLFAFLLQTCWLAGCGGPKPPEVPPTFPITGIVTIDGKPTPMVRIMLFPTDKTPDFFDPNTGAPHWANTDPEGKFSITTYNSGDGAPPGEYNVLFFWEGNPKVVPLADPDQPQVDPAAAKFNAKYSNPRKPQLPAVKVEDGKPTDVGTWELTAK
jgi:hypothetical protein